MKIKYDVTGSDPEEAIASGNFEQPKPGVYPASIAEVNVGFSKDEKTGKPDKKKPRMEVIFKIEGDNYKGAQVWAYYVLPGHPSFEDKDKKKGAMEKMDQLLLAVGFTDGKKNRSGEFDPQKALVGKKVRVRVRGGTAQDGETYRAEFGSVFAPGDDDDVAGDVSGDEELIEDDGNEEIIDEDEITEDKEYDWDARQSELAQMSVPDLKEHAKTLDITLKGLGTKSKLVDAILEAEQSVVAQAEGDDDEIIADDEEIIEDDGSEYLTEDALKEMETADLVETAKQFDVTTKGKKKSEVIAAILEAQAAPSGDDDEELPF